MSAVEYNYLDSCNKIRHIRMLGHFILTRRCRSPKEKYLVGGADSEENAEARLYIETLTDKCNWMEVLAIGKDVVTQLECGDFVLVPENFNEPVIWRGILGDPNLYVFADKALLAFKKGNKK